MTAQANLAAMYEKGEGVPEDQTKARQLYAAAAAHGLSVAQYQLASMMEQGRGGPADPPAPTPCSSPPRANCPLRRKRLPRSKSLSQRRTWKRGSASMTKPAAASQKDANRKKNLYG
ncbi:MAG: hypothetical protein R3F11_31645 [Verrucomicrobiales bacterium]